MQDPWTNTHEIGKSWVICKSWLVNAEIFVKKIIGLYVMLSQLIREVLIQFFQKNISVAPKAQDPLTNTHVIDESRVIPRSWLVNAEIFLKKNCGIILNALSTYHGGPHIVF